jgi:outer membrane receptor for ferrienterochelin and colicin
LGRNYNQSQNIYSIYGEYNIKGEKWSAKGGLRYEYTHLKSMDNHSSEFTNSYGNIVPNVSVIWKINSFNLLNISYKLYISRPNVSSLDPHVNNTDSKNIYYGNPQLKCEKEHNMSLSYNYSGDKMDCGLTSNFSLTENTINSYVYAEKDVLHHTYRNIGRLTVFNVHTYANANITSHLSANFDAYWSYVKYKQEAMGINAESPSFYGVNGGLELSLPWNLNLNLDAEWDSKEIEAQGKISSQYSYNLVLYRSFMKRHLTISLVASNFISKYLNTWSLREMPDYRYYSESHRYARGFRMTIAYRFGKLNKQVKKAQYSINNTDLKKNENDSSSSL